jgi:hypothetical protein
MQPDYKRSRFSRPMPFCPPSPLFAPIGPEDSIGFLRQVFILFDTLDSDVNHFLKNSWITKPTALRHVRPE